MVENILISDKDDFEQKRKKFIQRGLGNIHVLADFDCTLTKAFFEGNKSNTIISYLRNGNYLSKDYAKKAHELFDKYHPIEISHKISDEEKSEKMNEWWNAHINLLIESGLNKSDLDKVVNDESVEFRDGVGDFLEELDSKGIPLVILSSSGLGNTITMYLEKEKLLSKNIHVISNFYKWDNDGKAIGIHKPIIHVMNKSEISVKKLPIYDELLKRKNVLLLGDSLGDVGMVDGFDYENLIKIGFLNENVEENLERFKENYDVVITNDGDFKFINKFLREI